MQMAVKFVFSISVLEKLKTDSFKARFLYFIKQPDIDANGVKRRIKTFYYVRKQTKNYDQINNFYIWVNDLPFHEVLLIFTSTVLSPTKKKVCFFNLLFVYKWSAVTHVAIRSVAVLEFANIVLRAPNSNFLYIRRYRSRLGIPPKSPGLESDLCSGAIVWYRTRPEIESGSLSEFCFLIQFQR